MRILAISGSLRAESSNSRAVRALAGLSRSSCEVAVYDGLHTLPHFNLDLDIDPALPAVAELRGALRSADALIICSPEYAHGVPGSLKNAIDWVVSSGELMGKPVGLINLAPRAHHAQEQLAEILQTADAAVLRDASPAIFIPRRDMTVEEMRQNHEISAAFESVLDVLVKFLANKDKGEV